LKGGGNGATQIQQADALEDIDLGTPVDSTSTAAHCMLAAGQVAEAQVAQN